MNPVRKLTFVMASARLYYILTHIISSVIRSLYASIAELTYIISKFSVVDASLIITLKRFHCTLILVS